VPALDRQIGTEGRKERKEKRGRDEGGDESVSRQRGCFSLRPSRSSVQSGLKCSFRFLMKREKVQKRRRVAELPAIFLKF
jgi:hypothetical protein